MPIRYFIKQLLLPPGILLLLLALAWWFRRSRPRLAAVCFALGFGGMWLMSLPVVVEWGQKHFRPNRRCRVTNGRPWRSGLMPSWYWVPGVSAGIWHGVLISRPVSALSVSAMPRDWQKLQACRC